MPQDERREGRRVSDDRPPSGFDCGAGATVLARLWRADAEGKPVDASLMGAWTGHAKGCGTCSATFGQLTVLAGLAQLAERQAPRLVCAKPQDRTACLSVVEALRGWAGAKAVGEEGKAAAFEPTISSHMCGCYSCRALAQLFGEGLDLFFG